jgi:hypothetical protein
MRLPTSIATVVAGTIAVCLPAMAGVVGTIETTIDPVAPSVSYSKTADDFQSYLAFAVRVANVGGNVANAVVFTTQAVTSSNAGEAPTFHAVEGASCTTEGLAVRCALGQMRPGDVRTFTIVYKSPAQDADPATGDNTITFEGLTLFSEGTGGPKSKPVNSSAGDTAQVAVSQASDVSVSSVVPAGAGNFSLFTLPEVFDTRVTVPPQAAAKAASIVEAPFATGDDCNNFTTCYQSTVTIPGTFSPYLTIVLHQDASNIKSGTQIGSVQVMYDPDSDGPAPAVPVGLCASPTTPLTGAQAGTPCIASAVHYKNRSVPGWTESLDGDMVWTLINLANGSYRLP